MRFDAAQTLNAPVVPNFFIAGAPKAGTTSLYHYSSQHPEIYVSLIKEPNYFASEIRLDQFSESLRPQAEQDTRDLRAYLEGPLREKRFGGVVTEWHDYLKLFQQAEGRKAIGEASVCYLWSESAAANIRRNIPDARIILVLRNPIEMAISIYLQTVKTGALCCNFRDAMEMALEQRGGKIDVLHPFLDFGLYYEQVQGCWRRFRKNGCGFIGTRCTRRSRHGCWQTYFVFWTWIRTSARTCRSGISPPESRI